MIGARAIGLLALGLGLVLGPAVAATPASGHLPFKPSAPQEETLAWQALGVCLVGGVLAGGAVLAARRYGRGGPLRAGRAVARIEVQEVRRVGKQSHLIVVRFRNQELLLGESGQGLHLLARAEESI